MVAAGEITKKYNIGTSQSGPTYCVDYEFAREKNGTNSAFKGTATDYADYHQTSIGQTVEVLYMGFDPNVNMITSDAQTAAGSVDFMRTCPKVIGAVLLLLGGVIVGFVGPASAEATDEAPFGIVAFFLVSGGFLLLWFFVLRKRFPRQCGFGGRPSGGVEESSGPDAEAVGTTATASSTVEAR